MHYEDIKLKQSTYAIISFNDQARPGQAGPGWAGGFVPRGPSARLGWLAATTLDIHLSQTGLTHISSKESISQMCTTVSHNYIRAQWQLAMTWKRKKEREREEVERECSSMQVWTGIVVIVKNGQFFLGQTYFFSFGERNSSTHFFSRFYRFAFIFL